MALYTLVLLASSAMLLNACFSVMQYRKHMQLSEIEGQIELPVDIKLEIYLGLFLGLVSAIMNQTKDLKRSRL